MHAEELVNGLVAAQKKIVVLQKGIDTLQKDLSIAILLARRTKRTELSERRKANLKHAFLQITWDFEQATVYDTGQYYDKVSFMIPGLYKGVQVMYIHATPTGGVARLWVFKDGKKKVIRPAGFSRRKEVMKRLEQLVK